MIEEMIKNQEELGEEFREEDHMSQTNEIKAYLNKLKSIEKSGIIGLIGPFGCGKTTFINQVRKIDENNNDSIRIDFEARKYPNRENLWENFILDIAEYLDDDGKKIIIDNFSGKPTSIFDAGFRDGVNYLTKFTPAIKEYLFDRKKRELDVIEKCLKEILISLHTKGNNKGQIISTIYIVVEDIDRSGDAGTFFLETLNYFLKKNSLGGGLKTIVIATIGSKEFTENKDSYMKCLDYIHEFPIISYKYKSLLTYFINERYLSNNIVQFFEYIGTNFSDQFTTRTLKSIIRELCTISKTYEDIIHDDYELSIILGILLSKYLTFEKEGKKYTYINYRRESGCITDEGKIFKSYLYAINQGVSFLNRDDIGNKHILGVPMDINFVFYPMSGYIIRSGMNPTSKKSTIYLNQDLLGF